jgi:large subunit ribosomal protein L3
MTVGLLGRKVGMTQIFNEEGLAVPVTVVKLGANIVTEKMSKETHGYNAVQVGGFEVVEKKLNKPAAGQFKKRDLPLMKPLKEFRVDDSSAYNVGEPIKADSLFKEGMLIDVRGQSIGKGFQGTIKRYNHGRGPMAHGSKFHRSMGSIGAGTTPGRVYRGVHMPGRMGNQSVCIRHLKVVRVDSEKGLLLVRGSVPGVEGQLVTITPSKTKWNG